MISIVRKDMNYLIALIVSFICMIIITNNISVNDKYLDLFFLILIVIVGKKYLKIAIIITFLFLLLKTNCCRSKENFTSLEDEDTHSHKHSSGNAHKQVSKEDGEELDGKESDEKEDGEESDEKEDGEESDEKDDEEESEESEEKEDKLKRIKKNILKMKKPDIDNDTLYEHDCLKICNNSSEFKYNETECQKICTRMCPNPIKYKKDLKELHKLKKILEHLENDHDL